MKKNKLDIAKNLLSSGELVIFPTETVFGLGADATCLLYTSDAADD